MFLGSWLQKSWALCSGMASALNCMLILNTIFKLITTLWLASMAQLDGHWTGDQEVADLIPAGSAAFFCNDSS